MIYAIQNWIFIFFIYSFLGWCFETALVSIEEKRFVNRGFIRSPFLPIFGFVAITMIVSGTPVIKDPVLVFIFGAVFVQHFVNCKYHILPIIRKCSFCCFFVRQSTVPHIHNPLPFLNISYCKLSSCRFIHRLLL